MTDFLTFETGRLLLRPTDETDADFILTLLNTPKWIEFIGDRKVYSLDDSKKYIEERITPQLKRLGFSNYTVIRKSDGSKLGSCGLYDREGIEGIDIGFAFLPEYEGNGYAFEAAVRLKEAALSNFGLKKINAITTKENKASQKLLEKLGLVFTGFTRIPNDEVELMLYELAL